MLHKLWLCRLTHDEPARHLDGGIGEAPVPLLPENVLRFRAHLLASGSLNLKIEIK